MGQPSVAGGRVSPHPDPFVFRIEPRRYGTKPRSARAKAPALSGRGLIVLALQQIRKSLERSPRALVPVPVGIESRVGQLGVIAAGVGGQG